MINPRVDNSGFIASDLERALLFFNRYPSPYDLFDWYITLVVYNDNLKCKTIYWHTFVDRYDLYHILYKGGTDIYRVLYFPIQNLANYILYFIYIMLIFIFIFLQLIASSIFSFYDLEIKIKELINNFNKQIEKEKINYNIIIYFKIFLYILNIFFYILLHIINLIIQPFKKKKIPSTNSNKKIIFWWEIWSYSNFIFESIEKIKISTHFFYKKYRLSIWTNWHILEERIIILFIIIFFLFL